MRVKLRRVVFGGLVEHVEGHQRGRSARQEPYPCRPSFTVASRHTEATRRRKRCHTRHTHAYALHCLLHPRALMIACVQGPRPLML
jgi:hypothetical protein